MGRFARVAGVGVIVLMLALCHIAAGQASVEKAEALWAKVREAKENPEKAVLGGWALVEGCPIVKRIDNVPLDCAAAASVLAHFCGGGLTAGPQFGGAAELNNAMKKRIGPDLTFEVGVKCGNAYSRRWRRWLSAWRTARKKVEARDEFNVAPPGIVISVALYARGKGLFGKSPIEKTIRAIYDELLYVPTVKRQSCRLEDARTLLDKGTPFVLFLRPRDVSSARVCVGYVEQEKEQWLILGNPDTVPLGGVSHADLEVKPEKESDDPRVREAMRRGREVDQAFDEKFGKIPCDLQVSFDAALDGSGIEFHRFNEGCEMLIIPIPKVSEEKVKDLCRKAAGVK